MVFLVVKWQPPANSMKGECVWIKKNAFFDHGFYFCQLKLTPPPLLTLGWKNKKRRCGPIELDLEADNLVKLSKQRVHMYMCYMAGGGVFYNFQ